ncbi:MAG: ectonucleotide pyrophosphatase/phosphodiesterase [Lachnospiraceae bacterium]|nr:ectonucleotide pyrophosphatase/phosphodiesterase [Lachnospiraceae bacterium]
MIGKKKKYIGKKPHRMLVLSWDAVGSPDFEYLETLPHFKALLERGACCSNVQSVCPSLTYPAHATIVTGRTPANHGIVNNLRLQPERETQDWFWQRRFVKGTTLYDEAERAGLRTAALLWPVTGGSRITYNLPEIWPNRPWENQLMVSLLNGSPRYQADLYRRYRYLLDGIKQPMLDNFVQAALLRTLQKYHPDLMLVHLTDVDSMRHDFGVDSKEAKEALRRQDMRLGETLGLLERLGEGKTTNVILLGDHYQKNVTAALCPNYHIVEHGWAERNGDALAGWRVAAHSCDGACYIYLKDRKDRGLRLQVAQWLREWKQTPGSGIRAVHCGKRAWERGADPKCAFMLEAADGFYFKNGCSVPKLTAEDGKGVHLGAHGYDPDEAGYKTFFLAAGPDFQPGARIPEMYLTDEGPIMARALGLELEDADGAVLDSFFRFGYRKKEG